MKTPIDALTGEFIQKHPMGPVVWEQTRKEADAYYCENNLIATNIQEHATNSSPITNKTSGEAAEEYLSEYMVKEKASLKQAVPVLLVELDEITVHPSKAQDTGKAICIGKHLAQHTVNSFSGSHQWSMPLMASALFGNKSIVSSEIFRYVFPHANVSYVDELYCFDSNLEYNSNKSTSSKNDTNEYAHSCLDAVMAAVSKDDEHNDTYGGTNSYKTAEDQVVFLTQAESYYHHVTAFANYSQLEFESIVQLQDRATSSKNTKNDPGRKP